MKLPGFEPHVSGTISALDRMQQLGATFWLLELEAGFCCNLWRRLQADTMNLVYSLVSYSNLGKFNSLLSDEGNSDI